MTCHLCQTPLRRGEDIERLSGTRQVRHPGKVSYSDRATGDASRVRLASWICPTCRKTRAVGPADR